MNRELACKLASSHAELPLVDQCKLANELCDDSIVPFSPSDLAQIELTEWVRENCSDRERALIYVWTSLERCHRIIHIDWKTMRELPAVDDKKSVSTCLEYLTELGLEHLLGDRDLIQKFLTV